MISLKVTVLFLITISSALARSSLKKTANRFNSLVKISNKPQTAPDAKDFGVYLYALKDILDNCTDEEDFLDENYVGLFLAKCKYFKLIFWYIILI